MMTCRDTKSCQILRVQWWLLFRHVRGVKRLETICLQSASI